MTSVTLINPPPAQAGVQVFTKSEAELMIITAIASYEQRRLALVRDEVYNLVKPMLLEGAGISISNNDTARTLEISI